jgi:DNA-binding NtrC family response regulator
MSHILIVDDQACIRELLWEDLIHDGYRVATAGDPETARSQVKFFTPDLVVLDLYLDGPEGFGLFKDIKRIDPCLPVIIFTAYDSYREDPRLSEASGYVVKNPDLGELKQNITRIVSTQRFQARPNVP